MSVPNNQHTGVTGQSIPPVRLYMGYRPEYSWGYSGIFWIAKLKTQYQFGLNYYPIKNI